jgi:hypothetical protein
LFVVRLIAIKTEFAKVEDAIALRVMLVMPVKQNCVTQTVVVMVCVGTWEWVCMDVHVTLAGQAKAVRSEVFLVLTTVQTEVCVTKKQAHAHVNVDGCLQTVR